MEYSPGMFSNVSVAVLGFGVNNQSLTRWLLKQEATVTVCDEDESLPAKHPDLAGEVSWQVGHRTAFADLDRFSFIFRTPGIRPDHPAITAALARGRSVLTSQTELFFNVCPAPIVGITGTKGKGTTASLLSLALEEGRSEAGFGKVFLAGNIGLDPFDFIEKVNREDIVVLELSSFQLMNARLKPKVAIVLSISPDHLDYHHSLNEYIAAKSGLLRGQSNDDIAIIHEESALAGSLAQLTAAEVYLYSRHHRVDRGAYVAYFGDQPAVFVTGEETTPLLLASDLQIPGEHNLENAAAAALAAYLLGVSRASIRQAFSRFTGLPHRLQRVATKRGILCIDDSIATTPEAMRAALETFAKHPLHLIAGGVSKGVSLRAAFTYADQVCSSVALIGQNNQELASYFSRLKPYLAESMADAVQHLGRLARSGDVILLSPSSASFDMYSSYAARGDDFQRQVKELL